MWTRTYQDVLQEIEDMVNMGASGDDIDTLYNEALSLYEVQVTAIASLLSSFEVQS